MTSSLHQPPYIKGSRCPEPNPPLKSPSLVLSPLNSEAKLVSLIQSAWQTTTPLPKMIQCMAENWGDTAIQQALLTAADNGVKVQIIAPQCDQNPDPTYDFDKPSTLAMLIGHPNIEVKAMPAPPSSTNPYQPYMHSKMCRINNSITFIGSENFSVQSTQHNRELGIIFKDTSTSGARLDAGFEKDFAAANDITTLPVPAKFLQCPPTSAVLQNNSFK
jgi:cardiolipin synthase